MERPAKHVLEWLAMGYPPAEAELPLPDEPFVAAWREYEREASERGAWPVLCDKLVQLRFPIAAGLSTTEEYLQATRKGIVAPLRRRLDLEAPDGVKLGLQQTEGGKIPAIKTASRADYVVLARALAHRNEPVAIPDSQGALFISGLNNWDRIRSALAAGISFPVLASEKELYQDRLLLVSPGPYSGLGGAEFGYGPAAWSEVSMNIRIGHEATHYLSRRLYGMMRRHLFDELIADCAGLRHAIGRFEPVWCERFLAARWQHYLPPEFTAEERSFVWETLRRAIQGLAAGESRPCMALLSTSLSELAQNR